MTSRSVLLMTVMALSASATTARADFPSLPPIKNIAIGLDYDVARGRSELDLGDHAIKGFSIDVGLLLHSWPDRTPAKSTDPLLPITYPSSALVFYAGLSAESVTGALPPNLTANAYLKDTYFGADLQYRFTSEIGAFVGGDIRFTSFDSGRAYAADANRTAFTLSANGYGGELEAGFTVHDLVYVQGQFIARRWPSIVVGPPSGTMLPAAVPPTIWLETIGVSAGVMFSFDAAGGGVVPKAPA